MRTMSSEIRVMTSGTFTAAYLELIPQLELLTKRNIVTAATSMLGVIFDSAEKVCFGKNKNIFRPQIPYNHFSELD